MHDDIERRACCTGAAGRRAARARPALGRSGRRSRRARARCIGARVTFIARRRPGARRLRGRPRPICRRSRTTRTREEVVAAARDRRRHRRAAQPHDERRNDVRRGRRARQARRVRARGAAADGRSKSASRSVRRLALVGLARGPGRRGGADLGRRPCCSTAGSARSPSAAERYRAGDFSRPARDYGRDEIGIVANVLDDTARELGARLTDMARERAHMDAILTGMVEGVVLVNGAGRLVLTNPAARAMLRLPDGGRRPALSRGGAAARHRRATGDGARGRARPRRSKCSWIADARRMFVAHVGAGRARARRRRRAGAARHHRSAARRSGAARLRRQRLARTAHAAHGDSRLRRSAARRSAAAGRSAASSSRSSRATRCGWSGSCATCCGWRGSTPARKRSSASDCTLASLVGAVEHDLRTALEARGQRDRGRDLRRMPRPCRGDPAKLHDVAAQSASKTPATTARRAARSTIARAARRRPASRSRSPIAGPASRRPTCRASSSASIASTDRARAIPAAPASGLSIVRHLVELHGGTRDGRQPRGRRRRVHGQLPAVLSPSRDESADCRRFTRRHASLSMKSTIV